MSYKSKPRESINASSMADIAFLLLIFFLVTTTMDMDKGILVLLPMMDDGTVSAINDRDVLDIRINSKDELMVEKKKVAISELKNLCKTHIGNRGRLPEYSVSPTKAVVSLANDISASYGEYIAVYNEILAAYNELRNEAAHSAFGKSFKELSGEERNEIKEIYPKRLSEAEPQDFAKISL